MEGEERSVAGEDAGGDIAEIGSNKEQSPPKAEGNRKLEMKSGDREAGSLGEHTPVEVLAEKKDSRGSTSGGIVPLVMQTLRSDLKEQFRKFRRGIERVSETIQTNADQMMEDAHALASKDELILHLERQLQETIEAHKIEILALKNQLADAESSKDKYMKYRGKLKTFKEYLPKIATLQAEFSAAEDKMQNLLLELLVADSMVTEFQTSTAEQSRQLIEKKQRFSTSQTAADDVVIMKTRTGKQQEFGPEVGGKDEMIGSQNDKLLRTRNSLRGETDCSEFRSTIEDRKRELAVRRKFVAERAKLLDESFGRFEIRTCDQLQNLHATLPWVIREASAVAQRTGGEGMKAALREKLANMTVDIRNSTNDFLQPYEREVMCLESYMNETSNLQLTLMMDERSGWSNDIAKAVQRSEKLGGAGNGRE